MIRQRPVDCGLLYERTRIELLALVRSLTDEQHALAVSATPGWSVRDVIAHVVGIAADLNAQRFPRTDAEAWTEDQVQTRRHRSIDELADEWDVEAPPFEDGLRLFGYETGCHFLADLLQHSQDVRAALGAEPIADDEALLVGLDHYLEAFHTSLVDASVGSVAVRAGDGDGEWTLGSGPLVATLTASPFEVFRTLGGRRTADQVVALGWTGDVASVLPYVSAYSLADADVGDP